MVGIYCIKNKINNKIYIGETLNMGKRWAEHISLLDSNSHHSYKLQKEWNEYGKDAFEFKSMEVKMMDESPKSSKKCILYALEYYYMCRYDSIDCGYNVENTFLKIVNGTHLSTIRMNQPQILKMCFYVAFLNKYHNKVLCNVNSFLNNGAVSKDDFYEKFKWAFTKDFIKMCADKNKKVSLEKYIDVMQGLKIYNCEVIKPYTIAKAFMTREFKDQFDYDIVFNFEKVKNDRKEFDIKKKISPFKPELRLILDHIPSTSGVFYFEDLTSNKKEIISSENMNKECRNICKNIANDNENIFSMSETLDINKFKFTCLCVCTSGEIEDKLNEFKSKLNID